MASSRKSRSDQGILALSRALLQNVMGLNAQTAAKVMKLIRNSGQLQDLKVNMRTMNSMAYRRLNQVIDVVIKDKQKKGKDGKQEADQNDQNGQKAEQKKAVNETFLEYLLTEVTLDSEAIRTDPEAKQDAIRLTRANDSQAMSIEKRMRREKIQKDRKDLASEEDPRKKALRRSIMSREKQLQAQKDELTGTNGAGPDSGATM